VFTFLYVFVCVCFVVGLFNSVSTGVTDFFYEPAKGLIHSPQAFTSGITKGTLSLVQHTTFGVTNAVTVFLHSLLKGLGSFVEVQRPPPNIGVLAGISYAWTGTLRSTSQGYTQGGIIGAARGMFRSAIGGIAASMNVGVCAVEWIRSVTNPAHAAVRIRFPLLLYNGLIPDIQDKNYLIFASNYFSKHPNEIYVCIIHQPLSNSSSSSNLSNDVSRTQIRSISIRSSSSVPLIRMSCMLTNVRMLILRSRCRLPNQPVEIAFSIPLAAIINIQVNETQHTVLTYWKPNETIDNEIQQHSTFKRDMSNSSSSPSSRSSSTSKFSAHTHTQKPVDLPFSFPSELQHKIELLAEYTHANTHT
jgi:hypothetical protein